MKNKLQSIDVPPAAERAEDKPMLDYLKENLDQSLQQIKAEAEQWNLDAFRSMFHQAAILIRLRHAVVSKTQTGLPTYLVDAPFLEEAFHQLTRDRNESLSYVTGPEGEDQLFVLSRLIPLQLAHRSLARARSDFGHQIKVLTQLEEEGLRLLGCLHSHPGHGPQATLPSPVDLKMQGHLEQGGFVAVGGIFSRDGHVRFFSNGRQFRVLVTGKGIAQVGEKLFRLERNSRQR